MHPSPALLCLLEMSPCNDRQKEGLGAKRGEEEEEAGGNYSSSMLLE